MIKSETLFKTKEDVKKRSAELFGCIQDFIQVIFIAFLIVAVYFSLFITTYFLVISDLLPLAYGGYILLKLIAFIFVLFATIIFARIFFEAYWIRKIRRRDAREQLKQEILKEVKNGRNSKGSTR